MEIAVFNFHPFVIVKAPNSIKYLKDKGFDVFEDIFDSSYDKIIDKDERLSKIVSILGAIFTSNNSLDDLQKLRIDIYDRLLHNYNHFLG